jgi:hypothetical protein
LTVGNGQMNKALRSSNAGNLTQLISANSTTNDPKPIQLEEILHVPSSAQEPNANNIQIEDDLLKPPRPTGEGPEIRK